MKPPAPVTNAQGFIAFDILTSPPSQTFGVHTGHVTADGGALKREEGVARLLKVSVRQAAPTGRHCANGKRACERCRRRPIVQLLSLCHMPRLSGKTANFQPSLTHARGKVPGMVALRVLFPKELDEQ